MSLTIPRFYLRLMILPVVLFTAVLMFLHDRPYNDQPIQEMRGLFPPADCAAPCFMGIRPGVTTEDEALALLKAHMWVADAGKILPLPYMMSWRWNENAPSFLERLAPNENFMFGNVVLSTNEIVSRISFSTQFTLGDVLLAQGIPQSAQLIFYDTSMAPNPTAPLLVALNYEKAGFWTTAIVKCPYAATFWNAPVRFTITDDFTYISQGMITPVERKSFFANLYKISRQTCTI